MPTVNEGENQKDFVARCIPMVMEEGIRGEQVKQDQAVAVCYSMYRQHEKEKSGEGKFDNYHKKQQEGPGE